jgi:choline dehydrogenase-like flavoprotein
MTVAEQVPDPTSVEWDAIVIGAGMGGGTLGYALAQAGKRVLFVEKGQSFVDFSSDQIRGLTPEETCDLARLPAPERQTALARGCRSFDEVADGSAAKPKSFVPEIGNGTGGSSALFGMVLERLFPVDFTPRAQHADAADTTLPDAWPIDYDDLAPWYTAAERLYRVRGTADPLRPADEGEHLLSPPPLTTANAGVFDFLRQGGLHPYQLHLACEHLPDCQTCQGFLCDRPCKNDAGQICVAPALHTHGATLLSQCAALRFEAGPRRVDKLICHWRGDTIALRAKQFIVSAGALATPALLLRSTSAEWPRGLANASDQVGRNLMRHCIDMTVLRPRGLRQAIRGQTKELAFNDLYWRDGKKYGSVQSIGGLPPFLHYLGKLGPELRYFRYLRPLLGPLWDWLRVKVVVLASILEDLPYADNRVLPGDNSTVAGQQLFRLEYHLREREQQRAAAFAAELRELFKPYRPFTLSVSHDNKVIAHVCGTCRMGDDPDASVVDRDCRAHGVDNLYIADASFFASSGGINPSLTIAANALRIAAHLVDRG